MHQTIQHADHVRHFVPDAVGDELQHRVTLLKARDHAAALIGRSEHLQAFNLAHEAHEVAGTYVYSPASGAQLETAAKLARHLVMSAMLAENLRSMADAANAG